MEHAIHLGAGHFIQVVSPTSARLLVKKIKRAFRDGELNDDSIDFDALEADLRGSSDDDNDDDDGAASEAADFTVGDTIGKSLALVKQVSTVIFKWLCVNIALQIRSSPQATAFFGQCCRQAGVPELKLVQWIRTRWASMHNFLERMLILQKVSDIYNIQYLKVINRIRISIGCKLVRRAGR
jgi:hypothetical protein